MNQPISKLSFARKRMIIHWSFIFMLIVTGLALLVLNLNGYGVTLLLGVWGMVIGYGFAVEVEDQITKQLRNVSND